METTEVKKMVLEDKKLSPRIIISGLWIVLMILYIYCDIFSFYRPDQIQKITSGQIGFFPVNQSSLFILSALMIIPALMIAITQILSAKLAKWINIFAGSFYTLVNIGNLIGETWAYFLLFGIIEMFITILIVIYSIKWPQINK